MIKSIFIAVIALGTAAIGSATESAENLAAQFAGRPMQEQTLSNLPQGREQEVLAALIKDQAIYSEVLLRLNHSPTVERVLGEFIRSEGRAPHLRKIIERSGSPYIVDEIAIQLYKEDRLSPRNYEEHSDFGESAQAAEIIGQLVIKAPAFSEEVKAWAKSHLGTPGLSIIQAARAWWELNRESLLANQFSEVRIPASYGFPEQSLQQSADAEPLTAKPIAPPPTNLSQELDKTAVAGSVSTTAPLREPVKKGKLLWWILGLALLAATAALVLRKKR
jgi:hypothetical protein